MMLQRTPLKRGRGVLHHEALRTSFSVSNNGRVPPNCLHFASGSGSDYGLKTHRVTCQKCARPNIVVFQRGQIFLNNNWISYLFRSCRPPTLLPEEIVYPFGPVDDDADAPPRPSTSSQQEVMTTTTPESGLCVCTRMPGLLKGGGALH